MYGRQNSLSRLGRAVSPPSMQPITVPASVGGVNALDPLIAFPPQDCFYTINLMPSEYGLRLRKGYREWATGIGTTDTEVRAVIPFQGVDPANDKLFVATADGIYDVTTEGETSPTRVVTFSTTSGDAGFCNWTEFTTDAPETYLFVADPQNGAYQYDESTGTWARPSWTGVTEINVAFVALHKQRLWVVTKDSTDAFYSPVASIAGTFTKFVFGSKFTYGGKLLGLYNWTLDGGDGVDDYLVAIGRGGDVLAYRGGDPSSDWSLTGSFFVGEMPDSRRCAEAYAGELFILSSFGVVSLRDLVSGVDASDRSTSPSAKINRILRAQVEAGIDENAWQLISFPPDGFMQIVAPWVNAVDAQQYNQNLLTKAWGYWQNVPIKCAGPWKASYYMGAQGGVLYIYDGVLDAVTLAGGGEAIPFSILTAFQAFGAHGLYKQVGHIRCVTLSSGDVSYNLKAVYDYDIDAQIPEAPGISGGNQSLWDVGVWDSAIWGGSQTGDSQLQGTSGIGRTAAVAMRGESEERLTVIGWDLTLISGGFL